MDRELGFNMVQGQIGYSFKNIKLLNQAFTRKSYTEENGGKNNEILEFIGDKALDLAVVRLLIGKYGSMANRTPDEEQRYEFLRRHGFLSGVPANEAEEFSCELTEGNLTSLKSRMVQKKNLAKRIDELGFAELLLMGESDIKNEVYNEPSVKEDLFEAIIGAVTLDCGWQMSVIQSVVEAMLLPEDFLENDADDNYVRLIQDWETQENGVLPWFWFKEQAYTTTWYLPFDGISQPFPIGYDTSRLKFTCELKLLDALPIFRGFGSSKSEARMNVCRLAYEYLDKHGYLRRPTMRDEIGEPSEEAAINQLEILARRGYFSIPKYEFQETYDSDGNPIWTCICKIAEYTEAFSAVSSTKKAAKKASALKMLNFIISE